jgi:exoribonuclease II
MISAGNLVLYNSYLPGNKHGPRLPRKLEEVYCEIKEEDFPAGRYYMIIEISGEIKETGADF